MKKLKLNIKFLCFATCLSLALGIFPAGFSLAKVWAYTPSDSIISGGEFTTSSTNFPATSTDWDSASGSLNGSNIKSGIISTDTETFTSNQEEYGLGALPNSITSNKNYVYMINNGTYATRAGITSEEFTLDANSHYIISVDVATSLPVYKNGTTSDLESVASVYLTGGDIDESFIAINTNKNWKTYNFYVKTDSLNSTKVKLELWLGVKNLQSSVGAVLFDNAKAIKYDHNEFHQRVDNLNFTSDNNIYSDYSTPQVDAVINPSFEDVSLTGWEVAFNDNSPMSKVFTGVTTTDENFDGSAIGTLTNPGTNLKYNNNNVLYINNTDKAGVAYTSDAITIKRQTYYKLSVFAKTQNINENGATISIVPENEELSAVSFDNIKTTVTTNSITNNWTQYTFYILGSPFQDENISIRLALGDIEATENLEDKLVEGAVFFDDIEVYALNYKQYTNATEDANNKKVKLFKDGTASAINNAFFNFADTNYEGVYPLKPANWAINNDNTNSGIISTNKVHFNANSDNYGYISLEDIGFTRLQYDQSDDADNNLLMIYNPNSDFTAYTSDAYTLTNNTYYKLTVDAKTLTTGNAYIKIVSDSITLAEFIFNSNNDWSTHTVYFNNVFGDKDIKVEIGLGTESTEAIGYAFFDNVIIDTIEKAVFDEAISSEDTKIIDFSKETFSILSNETDGVYTRPSNWSISIANNDLIDAGVLVDNTNKLVISSIDADTNAKFVSKLNYKLEATEYYSLKFVVHATGLNDLEESGIMIGIDGTNYKFENLTATEESEYIFYIKGETLSSVIPYFGLKTKDSENSVTAYLDSIELKSVSEVDFTNMQTSIDADDENTPDNVIVIGTIEEPEETPTPPASVGNTFDWLLFPSLIIGLALIIAIIGVIARRTKIKKIHHTRLSNYDRTKTLHPELVRREAEEARKQKLQAIEEEILRNKQEIEEYEQAYKQRRDLAKAQKQEKKAQAEFKAYAKGRSKLAKKQEKLIAEKEMISSDEYLAEQEEKILRDYETSETVSINEEVVNETNIEPQQEEINQDTTARTIQVQNNEVEIINPDDKKDDSKK